MSHLEASGSPGGDVRRRLDLPEPVRPGRDILRELAKAGMSKRGLTVISDRKTARSVRAGLAREARQRSFAVRLRELRARVRALAKLEAPWAVLAVAVFLVGWLVFGSLLIAVVLAVVVLVVGPVAWIRMKGSGSSKRT